MNAYHVEPIPQEEQKAYVEAWDRALEEKMEEVVRRIAETPDLRLIGLTGPTCAGKTTTAKKLTDYLEEHGHRVHVISIDDFFYDKDILEQLAEEANVEIDYDSEDTIDMELLREKAESLLACRETQMPRFDFKTGYRIEGEVIDPEPEDVFLFEGIQILYPKVHEILNGKSYRSIYICPQTSICIGKEEFEPNELRLMRRLVRDSRYRASDAAFTLFLWPSVRANEEKSIFPNAHLCHEVIDSTMPYEVGMLKPYLEKILPTVPQDNEFYPDAQAILKSLSDVQEIPSDYMTSNSLYKEFI